MTTGTRTSPRRYEPVGALVSQVTRSSRRAARSRPRDPVTRWIVHSLNHHPSPLPGSALSRFVLSLILALSSLPAAADGARAQVADSAASRDRAPSRHPGPRIGLALSGGGARGLAHVGVLRALERMGVPIDAISGTSMGSLVGGLYAAGYSATDLEEIAREIEWGALFIDVPARGPMEPFDQVKGNPTLLSLPMRGGRIGLPSGVIAGQHVAELFARLTWPVQTVHDFRRLPIPFSAVATDIATGEAVVLDTGSLAGVMRASMSLPSVFAPSRLHGRVLLDGGLVRSLPARDVRALGADVVICSDVSEPLLEASRLRTMLDVLNQAVGYHGNESTVEERRHCDVYIRPYLDDLDGFSFERATDWIARGDSATGVVAAPLRELVARAGGPVRRPPGIDRAARDAPVRLAAVKVEAATPAARRFVRTMLAIPTTEPLDPDVLRDAARQVYESGLFETVTFALAAHEQGTVAVISAQGDNADRVGFGFRYDDRFNASLLFDATMRHVLGFGSTGRLSVRLGEQMRVGIDVARGRTLSSRWVLGTGASWLGTPIDFFEGRRRTAEATLRVTSANVTVGAATRGGGVGIQLKGEDARVAASIAGADSGQHRTFGSAAALVWWDDLDRPAFATRGTALRARYEHAAGGGSPFARWFATGDAVVPLSSRLSMSARLVAGASSRDSTIPLHYRFFLGSLTPSSVLAESQIPFAGRRLQERNGYAVAVAGAALQWEAVPNLFVTARGDVGDVGRTLGDAIESRALGAGLSIGSRTIAGPVELRLHGRTPSTARLEFSVGHLF
jgi:NTE family protein